MTGRTDLTAAVLAAVIENTAGQTRHITKGKGVEPPKVERREVKALRPEEARQIIEAVREHGHGPLYTLALATGLRQGELLGLRWADVDFDARVLHVRQTYGRVAGFDRPKTDRSRRDVPVPDFGIAALREQRPAGAGAPVHRTDRNGGNALP